MATKKTNKTNHVLNLLSTGVKKDEEERSIEQQSNSKQSKNINISTSSNQNVENTSNVSVVSEVNSDIANQIQKSLENEFENSKKEIYKTNDESISKEENDTKQIKQENKIEKSVVDKSSTQVQDDFIVVNVMDHLVKEKLLKYMEQFRCCTCKRCQADVTALALTGLPSKYVVINKNAVSPLLNFYSVRYAGQVTVEITKACIAVQATPRHKKD